MDTFELNIEYTQKGSDEAHDKEITVDLDAYKESYETDYFHLQQQYLPEQVENLLLPIKKDYLTTVISTYFDDITKIRYDINPIIDEIDAYISEIEEETDDDNDNDD